MIADIQIRSDRKLGCNCLTILSCQCPLRKISMSLSGAEFSKATCDKDNAW